MKFKVFRFKKVKSTNNTAIRILKNTNIHYGMISSEFQIEAKVIGYVENSNKSSLVIHSGAETIKY